MLQRGEKLAEVNEAGVRRDGRWLVEDISLSIMRGEILTLIGRIANVPNVATTEVSAKVMLRVAKAAELWSKVTGKAPITTYKNTMYVLQHGYVDPSKAIEELGLPQTPIETAIADAVKWFRENGYA